MPKTYNISKKEAEQIKEIRKGITNKREDKRLYAVQLRGEGLKNEEIAKKLDTLSKVVSRLVCEYKRGGIEALYQKRGIVKHRNMTYEEEEQLLLHFVQEAENGQIVEVLKRHNWRKVMQEKDSQI